MVYDESINYDERRNGFFAQTGWIKRLRMMFFHDLMVIHAEVYNQGLLSPQQDASLTLEYLRSFASLDNYTSQNTLPRAPAFRFFELEYQLPDEAEKLENSE